MGILTDIGKAALFLGAAGGGTGIALWLLRQKSDGDDPEDKVDDIINVIKDGIDTLAGQGPKFQTAIDLERQRDRGFLSQLLNPGGDRKRARATSKELQRREKARKSAIVGGTGFLGNVFDLF